MYARILYIYILVFNLSKGPIPTLDHVRLVRTRRLRLNPSKPRQQTYMYALQYKLKSLLYTDYSPTVKSPSTREPPPPVLLCTRFENVCHDNNTRLRLRLFY